MVHYLLQYLIEKTHFINEFINDFLSVCLDSYLAIAEHSMCHPGRPGFPHGVGHAGSPGFVPFQRAKSSNALFKELVSNVLRSPGLTLNNLPLLVYFFESK